MGYGGPHVTGKTASRDRRNDVLVVLSCVIHRRSSGISRVQSSLALINKQLCSGQQLRFGNDDDMRRLTTAFGSEAMMLLMAACHILT